MVVDATMCDSWRQDCAEPRMVADCRRWPRASLCFIDSFGEWRKYVQGRRGRRRTRCVCWRRRELGTGLPARRLQAAPVALRSNHHRRFDMDLDAFSAPERGAAARAARATSPCGISGASRRRARNRRRSATATASGCAPSASRRGRFVQRALLVRACRESPHWLAGGGGRSWWRAAHTWRHGVAALR
jgi:hypothetical protein